VELNLENAIEATRIAMPHLATPHGAQDQCLYAASFFRGLLAAADIDSEIVGGEYVDLDRTPRRIPQGVASRVGIGCRRSRIAHAVPARAWMQHQTPTSSTVSAGP
jgi:hypothetical protein